jgi:hypothetical protein
MNEPFSFKDKGGAAAAPILDQPATQNIDDQN